jgi:CHAT domain-containing protein
MSFIVSVDRKSQCPDAICKYEVHAYSPDAAWGIGPFDFELERQAILNDFQGLLPAIMASSTRFRSALKFEQVQEEPLDTLIRVGKKIYSSLNADVRQAIEMSDSVHFFTNEIEVPWEIMYSGEQFLGLNRPFGISPLFKRSFSEHQTERKSGRLRILMIVDTKNNLPLTRYETQKIQSLMEENTKVDLVVLEGDKATYGKVRGYLQQEYFDIVHVASHAGFEQDRPEESGVILDDGVLHTRDIYNSTKIDPPWLVFMNACESARIRDLSYFGKYEELSGLAFAFVKAGARSYIGTTSVINDSAASEIAVTFYSNRQFEMIKLFILYATHIICDENKCGC